MAASERTRLLPMHNQGDLPVCELWNEEEFMQTTTTTRSRCWVAWGAVLVLISCLAFASPWIRGDRESSTVRSSHSTDVPSTRTAHVIRTAPTTAAATVVLSSSMADSHLDQWEEWKRQITPNPTKKAMFHQHVELAQQIIDWEAWQAKLEQLWDNEKPQVQEGVAEAKKTLNMVETLADSKAKEFKAEADQQWNTFVDSSDGFLTGELQQARNVWNSTLTGVENEHWWSDMSHWFQDTWVKYADDAHVVWVDLQEKANEEGHVMWNKTIENERKWYANALTNMHKLGGNMRAWWANTSAQVGDEEQQIQENFKEWWITAEESERAWWMDTRQAYSNFTRDAAEKEKLWWDIVQHSSKDFWNRTVETSEHAWEEARAKATKGWNVTEHELKTDAKNVWSVTAHTEEEWRHAVEKWFGAHATYAEEMAQPLLYMNTTATFAMLMNGYGWFDYSHDFFLYQQGWDAQINQAYCAVASSAAVLNSLRSLLSAGDELPVDASYQPYHYATQLSLMNQKSKCVNDNVVRHNATYDGIFHPPFGLSMRQAKELLLCYLPPKQFDVIVRYVDPETVDIDQMRMEITEALRDPMSRVFINFDRQTMGQVGGGHFSPLGSYYVTEDRFLVLDVAKYKYPAMWVPAARLFGSMATLDVCGNPDRLPSEQDKLAANFNISDTKGPEDFAAQLQILGCKPTYRGYIIVTTRQQGMLYR